MRGPKLKSSNRVSDRGLPGHSDHVSLKPCLPRHRNSSQRAARIPFNPIRFHRVPVNASHHTGHCETPALRLSPLRTHVQAGIVSSSVRLQLSDMPRAHCKVTCLKATHLKSLACQVLQNFKYLSVVIPQTSIISSLICCNEITSCCPHRWPIETSGPEGREP